MLITISGPDLNNNLNLCNKAKDYINKHYSNLKAKIWKFSEPSDSLPAKIKGISQIITFKKELLDVTLDKNITLYDYTRSKNHVVFVPSYYSNVLIDQVLDIDSFMNNKNEDFKDSNYALIQHIIELTNLPKPDLNIIYIPDYNESNHGSFSRKSVYDYSKTIQINHTTNPFLNHGENPPIYIRNTNNVYTLRTTGFNESEYSDFFTNLSNNIKNHLTIDQISDQINDILKQLFDRVSISSKDEHKQDVIKITNEDNNKESYKLNFTYDNNEAFSSNYTLVSEPSTNVKENIPLKVEDINKDVEDLFSAITQTQIDIANENIKAYTTEDM